jgi:SAM-dependent methyltransferase
MASDIRGTQGYAEQAETLLVRYESFSFDEAHAPVLHLVPVTPGRILDIGSGTGRDAAHLAGMGHRVTAVEPTDAFRIAASRLHPSTAIDWVDDGLPDLKGVVAGGEQFDLVMLTAVWMHLDAGERRRAMPVVASLIRPGGVMLLSLRHGRAAEGRRMFAVSPEETIDLAGAEGLAPLLNLHTDSEVEFNRREGITWTRLAFEMGNGQTEES